MHNQGFIEGEELMQLVREQISMGQVVRYLPFRGKSMLPMLREGKDSIELSPLPDRLKKYDLPVYQYPSGKYVMHRVVAVKDDYYIAQSQRDSLQDSISRCISHKCRCCCVVQIQERVDLQAIDDNVVWREEQLLSD